MWYIPRPSGHRGVDPLALAERDHMVDQVQTWEDGCQNRRVCRRLRPQCWRKINALSFGRSSYALRPTPASKQQCPRWIDIHFCGVGSSASSPAPLRVGRHIFIRGSGAGPDGPSPERCAGGRDGPERMGGNGSVRGPCGGPPFLPHKRTIAGAGVP